MKTDQTSSFSIPGRLLKSFDMFAIHIPNFTLAGQTKFQTYAGGVVSMVLSIVVFTFALLKLEHMISRKNPNVNAFVDKNQVLTEDVFEFAN